MKVSDKCKDLEKLAKASENENRLDSIELYKQAAECFRNIENVKESNINLKKAAQLLIEMGKLSESPTETFRHFEHSSSLYAELGDEKESERVLKAAYQNFIDVSLRIKSETKKISDIDVAEQRLKLASEYALQGKDEKLSHECWIDLGDRIRQVAIEIEDPYKANKFFQRAISNYRKAKIETKEYTTIKYIAEKFTKQGNYIFNSKKRLAQALENFNQASKFYQQIKSQDQIQVCEKKMVEICDLIGIPKNTILDFLQNQPKKMGEPIIAVPKRDIPIAIIDDEPQKLVRNYFEELKKHEPDIGKTIVQQESVNIPKDLITKKIIKQDEKIKTEVIEQLEVERTIPDFMEDLETKIKSSEVIKTRIKKEIQQGKPERKKEKRRDKKKTKEINQLFDKALDGINEETEYKSADITSLAKNDERPNFIETSADIPKVKDDLVLETDTEIIDNDERTRFKNAVVGILKVKADFVSELDTVSSIDEIEKNTDLYIPVNNNLKKEGIVSSKLHDNIKDQETQIRVSPITDYSKIQEELVPKLQDIKLTPLREKKLVIGTPIIDILRKQGYIENNFATVKEMFHVPEYEILSIIVNQHPIPLEQIEKKSHLESISLVLSNLQADGLIVQTNDYQWTISEKVMDNLEKTEHDPVPQKIDQDDIIKLRSRIERNSKFDRQFIFTMYKFDLIPNRDKSITSLMMIPEFAIIRTIKDNEPTEFNVIKDEVSTIPPVQVRRILSRLELDGHVSQTEDGLWELSDDFVIALIK